MTQKIGGNPRESDVRKAKGGWLRNKGMVNREKMLLKKQI